MATVLRDPLPSSSPALFLLHSIFSSIFSLLPFSFLPLYFPSFAPFLSIRPPSFNRAPPSIHPSVPFAPFFLRSRTLNLLELFSFFFSFSLSLLFFISNRSGIARPLPLRSEFYYRYRRLFLSGKSEKNPFRESSYDSILSSNETKN